MTDYYNKDADVNQVSIEGNVGSVSKLIFAPGGVAVLRFGIATKYPVNTKSGTNQLETTWTNIRLEGVAARAGAKVIKKGTRLAIDGRLITSKFKDKDTGKPRYSTEVVVSEDYGSVDIIRGGMTEAEYLAKKAKADSGAPF